MFATLRRQSLPFILTLLLGSVSISLSGQDISQTRFHHLTQDDVTAQRWWRVFQSHDGFIWLCNSSGLYRFDGYELQKAHFKVPPGKARNEYSILQIKESPPGIFWMATVNAGLIRFDMYSGDCEIFDHDPKDSTSISDNFVTRVGIDSTGKIWAGTPKGLNLFDYSSKSFQRFTANPDDSLSIPENTISNLLVDEAGTLWLSHFKTGLSRLKSLEDGVAEFENISLDPANPGARQSGFATALNQDPSGNIWAGVSNVGLVKLAAEASSQHEGSRAYQANHEVTFPTTTHWIETDAHGRIWAGTNVNLYCYAPEEGKSWQFAHDPRDPFSIGHNRQTHLYRDRQGLMWLTLFTGMDIISPYSHPIQNITYSEQPRDSTPLRGAPFAVHKDSYDNIWIGTNKQGLVMKHGQSGKYFYFKQGDGSPGGFNSIDVLDFYEDDQRRLWMATIHGLARLDLDAYFPSSGENFVPKFKFYPYQEKGEPANALCNRIVYDLEPDPKGGFWLATYLGLSYFDPEKESFHNLLDSTAGYLKEGGNYYMQASLDQEGNLWLATYQKGLKMLPAGAPFSGESLIHIRANTQDPHAIPSDFVKSIRVDSRNQLWIGTTQGLSRLDSFRLDTDTTFYFSSVEKNKQWGCNNIFEDHQGRVWYNIPGGYTFINPDNSPGIALTESDGLAGDNPSLNTYFLDKEGTIYLGTGGGISIFHPDSLRPNRVPPKVVITSFQLFNKEVNPVGWTEPGAESQINLPKQISYLDELRLQHKQSVLTFEYAALNYYQSEKNEYAYMMEGFDQDWVYAGKRRSATYTNLDPGTYYFRVKASNNDGLWNEEGASLKIIIDPPWYRSWWAFILYGSLITAAFGFFLYARVRKVAREYETQARIERAKSEERESVRKRSSRDFHDEAGNKLTKLSLYTELTKRKVADDPDAITFLNHIESNVRELATGMRDFIWVLDPEKDTVGDTLNRLKDFGDQLFEHSETRFTYDIQAEELKDIPLDIKAKRHLLLIFKEAMNNSLKYAKATHSILSVERKANHMLVSFEDNGVGFDIEKVKKGNGLRNMQARAKEIGGSLSLISRPGEGTRLVFELPLDPSV